MDGFLWTFGQHWSDFPIPKQKMFCSLSSKDLQAVWSATVESQWMTFHLCFLLETYVCLTTSGNVEVNRCYQRLHPALSVVKRVVVTVVKPSTGFMTETVYSTDNRARQDCLTTPCNPHCGFVLHECNSEGLDPPSRIMLPIQQLNSDKPAHA